MRDVDRIKRILTLLEQIWNKVPDWRFGLLLSNMLGSIISKHIIHDIFFPEDNKWEEYLKEYLEELKGPY